MIPESLANRSCGSVIMNCFSCLFGCFVRPSTPNLVADDERREILEKSFSGGSDGSDSSSDEGADCQQDLWKLVLRQKLSKTKQCPTPINVEVSDNSTTETFLQTLTASYNENGFAQKMPRVREIFSSMEPFVITINTMVQSNIIASLVWGSLTLVFQVSSAGDCVLLAGWTRSI